MLHELLLALSGYPGSIFTLSENNTIKITDSLPFCHPSEREVLNQICRLGSSYYHLKLFVSKHNSYKSRLRVSLKDEGLDADSLSGLYVQALCAGLTAALTPYREDLLKLEQDVLNDTYLGLSHFHYSLDKYKMLLPQLVGLVTELQNKKCHGCQILEVVHRYSASGIPIVQTAMKKIHWACHGVLFKQLSSWLLHGILLDPHNEFFVQKCGSATPIDDSSFLDRESIFSRSEDDETSTTKTTFSLRLDTVPSYIPMHLAETILFIGESIETFERKSSVTSLAMSSNKMSTILNGKEEKFAQDLYRLHKEEELKLSDFESVVDNIRICVSEHLWELMVEKSDLFGHLKAIKDMFLMGRGELFLAFIDQSNHILSSVPTLNTEHDANRYFQVAARSILMEEKKSYLQRFFLKVSTSHQKINQSSIRDITISGMEKPQLTGWKSLRIVYTAHWPVHILFTPSILEKYNTIFQFILTVRRVQLELEKCWILLIKNGKRRQEYAAHPNTLQLRFCMAFIVNNLQYYLQAEVLECQWHILSDKIVATRDFEQIQTAHHNYLTNILAQTFLFSRKVSKCLMEFLDVCLCYCSALKGAAPLSPQQLQFHIEQFHLHSNLLLKILRDIRNHQASPHLAQFLKRIDLNDAKIDFTAFFL